MRHIIYVHQNKTFSCILVLLRMSLMYNPISHLIVKIYIVNKCRCHGYGLSTSSCVPMYKKVFNYSP
jgi:hypothetical protein